MTRYILYRLAYSVIVVLGAVTVVFFLLYLTGDPVGQLLPLDATPADREALRSQLGFDQPFYIQYFRYISRLAHGDFGTSLRYRQDVMPLILQRVPATLKLTAASMLVALLIAIPAGIISALKRNTLIDSVTMFFALLGQCMPNFWLGLMLIVLFAVTWRILPPAGSGTWKHLVLPAITLGSYSAAILARLLRSSLLEVLNQDYIRTAQAKGLRNRTVLWIHAFRNASIPLVTIIGIQVGVLMGGAIVTEYVFAYPGLGRLVLEAISARDFPVVQASVLFIAVTISVVNLLVDISYVILDPRIRYD
ncbi:MAG: ABC transporter permease [Caldilineaceae bacterium]|nr:ABC transporter permease [Caldilineaceae bacterium]MCB9138710.1 ABC transporter permease [Caldilineaceae bacterium]